MVVDASVMIAWLLNEPQLSLADEIYQLLAEQVVNVPAHWPVEVGNALAVNMRRGRIRVDQLSAIEQRIAALNIVVASPTPVDGIEELVHFSVNHELTVYDAAYVLLARRMDDALATVDRDMRVAARRLGIRVLPT